MSRFSIPLHQNYSAAPARLERPRAVPGANRRGLLERTQPAVVLASVLITLAVLLIFERLMD